MSNKEILILLDADVIIHLFKADKISILSQLYPERLVILDIVLNELKNNTTIRGYIDNFFRFADIKELQFPTTSQPAMLSEFIKLKDEIDGQGERACLVYCKYFKHIIASSNTSEIRSYCEQNSIAYLTTLDIFAIAIRKKILTNKEVNTCIKKILKNNSHLCCNNIEEHLKKHFNKQKYLY